MNFLVLILILHYAISNLFSWLALHSEENILEQLSHCSQMVKVHVGKIHPTPPFISYVLRSFNIEFHILEQSTIYSEHNFSLF